MRYTLFTTAIITLCISHVSLASAQSMESDTGSGSSMETGSGSMRTVTQNAIDAVRAFAPGRLPQKLKDVQVPELKLKAWLNESEAARTRLWQHRSECREAIRRANRDQLMERILTCYRSDLLQDINILRKQAHYISSIPLIDATLRSSATGSITALTDAQMAIVNAIDTGLFEQPQNVEEAKRNLRSNYREPYWLAQTHLQADEELTWVIFMVKNIENRLTTDGQQDSMGLLLENAAVCLQNVAGIFSMASRESDRIIASQKLMEGRNLVQDCRKTLKKVAQKEQQDEAQKAEEQESQQ